VARLPPSSEPANSWFFRPSASGLIRRLAALLRRQARVNEPAQADMTSLFAAASVPVN
jgi:hypothetical protein